MRILLTGVTGLIGKQLTLELLKKGYSVSALVREPKAVPFLPPQNLHPWHHTIVPEGPAITGFDAIINLAGENIANGRWTPKRKRRIIESRTVGTGNLIKAISALPPNTRPKALINASAVGIYGSNAEQEFDESSYLGNDFLAQVCQAWEKEANAAANHGVRVVNLRIGVVLSGDGGALAKMGPVILGDGRQWLSWIHIDDLVGFIQHAILNSSISGPYNLSSPNPVRQRELALAIKKIRNFPIKIRIPQAAISLALGEMSQIVLGSTKVTPRRTIESGFKFKYNHIEEALAGIFNGQDSLDQPFTAAQFIQTPRTKLIPFFSKPENLEELTPPWLNFQILTDRQLTIGKGSIIDYRLKIHGIRVRWRTLISDWNLPESFTDEQLKGPYRKWHHVHSFYEVNGGTLLIDKVTFQIPASWPGKILLSRLVNSDIRKIFEFRRKKILEIESAGGFL